MKKAALLWGIAVIFLASGCGSGSSPGDGGVSDGGVSLCGKPGDQGNSLGVGKYCTGLNDCIGLTASLCSILFQPNTYFCTFQCNADGGAAQCGDNATCYCQVAGCGCTPTACVPH